MHPTAIAANQLEQGVQGDRLGNHRHARQTQAPGDRPAVRHPAPRQIRILRLQPDRETEAAGILHGPRQHLGVYQGFVGLRKPDATRLGQLSHLGQYLALETDRQRTQWIQVGLIQAVGTVLEHFDQTRLIEHRIGVRRTDDAGHASGERRLHL